MNAENVCVCTLFVVRKRMAHCVSASKSSLQKKVYAKKIIIYIKCGLYEDGVTIPRL